MGYVVVGLWAALLVWSVIDRKNWLPWTMLMGFSIGIVFGAVL